MCLRELITPALEEYESLALSLAREPLRLGSIRAKLAEHHDICPPFDVERFTHHLETAYTLMWEHAQRSEKPTPFDVIEEAIGGVR